jgi:hypothetical protein
MARTWEHQVKVGWQGGAVSTPLFYLAFKIAVFLLLQK